MSCESEPCYISFINISPSHVFISHIWPSLVSPYTAEYSPPSSTFAIATTSLFEHSVMPLPSLSPISDHPTPHSDIAATVQPTVATLPQEEHTGMSLVKVMLLLDQKHW